ncbi:MAG: thiamine-phosphate kinase [Pseudomonadota bacterium]
MTDRIESEGQWISDVLQPLVRLPGAFDLKDDCATLAPLEGNAFVFKTDPVRAGVHFHADEDPAAIAWKALAVGVSDLAAKAARPVAYLMSVSFPEAPSRAWADAFGEGLAAAQAQFGLSLVGGDTDRASGPLSLSATVIGEIPTGRTVLRTGAKAGDRIFVSGTLGAGAIGLALREGAIAIDDAARSDDDRAILTAARDRYLRPEPRLALRAALRRSATAAMDISDGLVKDAGRLCAASQVGAEIAWPHLPVDAAVRLAHGDDDASRMQAAAGHGDDYEILATVPPDSAAEFARLATAAGIEVTDVGVCTASGGARLLDKDGREIAIPQAGYDHF